MYTLRKQWLYLKKAQGETKFGANSKYVTFCSDTCRKSTFSTTALENGSNAVKCIYHDIK